MNKEIKKYRNLAILGTILMGIGSYMACLAVTNKYSTIGTIILIISLIFSIIGFSKWQP